MAKPKAQFTTSVAIAFDATRKTAQPASVSDVPLSEAELVTRALATSPGMTIEQLAHDGTLERARTLIRIARPEVGKAAGAADGRLAAAFDAIDVENRKRRRLGKRLLKITPATLARRASTNNATALRWFTREMRADVPA